MKTKTCSVCQKYGKIDLKMAKCLVNSINIANFGDKNSCNLNIAQLWDML